MDHQLITLCILAIIGCFTGMVDTIGGGGGLIALPVLLGLGLPPAIALGTNKLQSIFGESLATFRFVRHGNLDFGHLKFALLFTAMGGFTGAVCVQFIHAEILSKIVPFLLLLVLVYMLISPKLGKEDRKKRLSEFHFYLIFGLALGFYNGFFGPATGSFWAFAIMFFLGKNIRYASMHMKPLNLIGNLASLGCFIYLGNINYQIAIVMGAGQLVGARIGSFLVLHKGTQLIRPVFLVVVTVMTIDLLLKNFV
jgi:uncharacterized protein